MSTMDYTKARETMVEQQVRPWDVLDVRVLDVLVRLPREAFVPETHRALAYADIELPLGHGERMMKPVVEGRALQALELQAGDERSEEHTSELQSIMSISYAVFWLKKNKHFLFKQKQENKTNKTISP